MVNFDVIKLSQTNCYLLKAEEGYLLIDCGNKYDKQVFLNSIRKREIVLTDIRYLFLTHHHNDHCGLLTFLTSANPKIQVIMSKKCATYLKIGTHFRHIHEHYSNLPLRLIISTYSRLNKSFSESFEPYVSRSEDILIEGDNATFLPELGINGQILLTPGHTEDSISLITENAAFVGDATRNMLNFTGSPHQPILLYDLDVCRKSWHKITCAESNLICPAHGSPFRAEKIKALLKR